MAELTNLPAAGRLDVDRPLAVRLRQRQLQSRSGQVAVTGAADVSGGNLVVDLPIPNKDLDPNSLGSMMILTAGGAVTGPFHDVVLSAGTDSHWDVTAANVTCNPNDVVLDLAPVGPDTVWAATPGDANLDDEVWTADLGILAGNWEQPGDYDWMQADFTFDGSVSTGDLGILAGNWGSGVTSAAVPEPSCAALLLIVLPLIARRRRKA